MIDEAFKKLFGDMYLSDSKTAKQIFEYGYKAGAAAENESCAKLIESYQIPAGNSPAGEMACEWTYAALREVCEAIRARMK